MGSNKALTLGQRRCGALSLPVAEDAIRHRPGQLGLPHEHNPLKSGLAPLFAGAAGFLTRQGPGTAAATAAWPGPWCGLQLAFPCAVAPPYPVGPGAPRELGPHDP